MLMVYPVIAVAMPISLVNFVILEQVFSIFADVHQVFDDHAVWISIARCGTWTAEHPIHQLNAYA